MPLAAIAGSDDEAIAQLKQAVSENRRDYRSRVELGKAQARLKLYDEAIESLRSAVFLKANLAEPHIHLAKIYTDRDELDKAVREFEMAREINPESVAATDGVDDLYARLARAMQQTQTPELRALYERMARMRDAVNPGSQMIEQSASAAEPDDIETTDPAQQALNAMEVWRKAWSGKDMDAYFAAYAVDFNPGDKYPSLAAWQNHKRKVIGKKAAIKVTIENAKPYPLPDGSIKVFFRQHYRSGAYQSNDMKMLWLKNSAEGWKIFQEATN